MRRLLLNSFVNSRSLLLETCIAAGPAVLQDSARKVRFEEMAISRCKAV
jgi:hypothetical protein